MDQQTIDRFVVVLKDCLYSEVVLHDSDLHVQLDEVDPSTVRSVASDNATYLFHNDKFIPVPHGSLRHCWFIVSEMKKYGIGYVRLFARNSTVIDDGDYEKLYGRLIFTLHDDTTHDVYYFMGTALKPRRTN